MGRDGPQEGGSFHIMAQICSRGNPLSLSLPLLCPLPHGRQRLGPVFLYPSIPRSFIGVRGPRSPAACPEGQAGSQSLTCPYRSVGGGTRSSGGAKHNRPDARNGKKSRNSGVLLTNSAGNGGFRKCQVPDSFLSCRWGDRRGSAAAKPRRRHPATGGPRGWGGAASRAPRFRPRIGPHGRPTDRRAD